jgi:hypothetical protein
VRPDERRRRREVLVTTDVLKDLDIRTEFGQAVITVATAARLTGIPPRTIRRYCARGRFRGAYQWEELGDWRIPVASIEELLGRWPI